MVQGQVLVATAEFVQLMIQLQRPVGAFPEFRLKLQLMRAGGRKNRRVLLVQGHCRTIELIVQFRKILEQAPGFAGFDCEQCLIDVQQVARNFRPGRALILVVMLLTWIEETIDRRSGQFRGNRPFQQQAVRDPCHHATPVGKQAIVADHAARQLRDRAQRVDG